MLLSRFWYLFLAVATAGAIGAAMLSQGVINGLREEQAKDALRRDRLELEAFLRLEARSRLDRISFITVDGKTGQLLRQARGVTDARKLGQINGELKGVLREQVKRVLEAAGDDEGKQKRVKPDIVFALDSDGRIIAQLGPMEANPPGTSLATYPLIKRALQGYVRDDVWVYDRKVYRMAARPVMFGSAYAGVIVHGYRFQAPFVHKLGKSLAGASIAFYRGTSVLEAFKPEGSSHAPDRAIMVEPLQKVLADEEYLAGKRITKTLRNGSLAVYSPVTGAAADSGVGYVIARPVTLLSSPMQLFDEGVSKDDVKKLPLPMLLGGAVLLALIGLLFMFLERDKPFRTLLAKTASIAAGERDRLIITEWRGAYRKLADALNQAIDKEVEKAAKMSPTSKKKANLDEILGPTPEAESSPFFGFAGGEGDPNASAGPTPDPSATPAPAPSPAPTPAPLGAAPPAATPPAAAPAPPAPPAPPVSAAAGNGFDEPAHWREVFEQYVDTRKQCGEATENLTFEKFEQTLRKTRDQIMTKHNASAVRFAVQIKQGKAALKAQPVKK